MPDLLEFEEPIGVLLKEIEALSLMPRTADRERSIETLRRRADEIRAELYANLTPWQRVLVARHPNRPNTLDYVERLFTGWDETPRRSPVCRRPRNRLRLCRLPWSTGRRGWPQKVAATQAKIYRNFGYARPEVIARRCGSCSSRRSSAGRSWSSSIRRRHTRASIRGAWGRRGIAFNLREAMMLEVPIVVLVCGEGGGGALGIAIGDRVLMQEFSVYSVIPLKGVPRFSGGRKPEDRGGGSVEDHGVRHARARLIDGSCRNQRAGPQQRRRRDGWSTRRCPAALAEVSNLSVDARLSARYDKFRKMGEERSAFVDANALPFDDLPKA